MARRILGLLAVGILIPACKIDPAFLPLPALIINAQLRGSQVVPAVAVPVTTTNATLAIPDGHRSLDYSVTYTGSGTITAVEIRQGVPGTNGPVLFTLATGPFTNPLTGTLTGDPFFFFPAVDSIIAGEAYILISTAADPTGEMRAQLGAATLASAVLNGAQEVPPVAGTGTGTFTLSFDSTQATLTATLTFSGLTSSADAAHLHFGAAGTGGGPIVFDLSLVPFTSPLVVTLTSTDVQTLTFEDAIDALMTGNIYVNVHTTTNAGGEIRGQVGPARLSAALTDGDVAPPVVSGFIGDAQVILNATQTEALIQLTHDVLSANSVRLCIEDPGLNGPLLYDVDALAGSAASPLEAILHGDELIPSPPRAILTFTDFANALLTGKTYLEVRSPSFPDGAIRGQILP